MVIPDVLSSAVVYLSNAFSIQLSLQSVSKYDWEEAKKVTIVIQRRLHKPRAIHEGRIGSKTV
eukprot:4306426-Amphidinium_carterae.1